MADATPKRTLTFFNGLGLVIGLQIGSGIFSTPAAVATFVPTPVLGVCVWAFAGLLVWTGALAFAELAACCPENGGIQEYLCHCFGELYGFLFAAMWILVVKPCAMGMIATIFAEYLYRGFAPLQESENDRSLWVIKGVALIAIALVTYWNCMGTAKAANTLNVFLVLKISTLGTIICLGFLASVGSVERHRPLEQSGQQQSVNKSSLTTDESLTDAKVKQLTPDLSFNNVTDALLAALFAFGGWESIGYVAGEIIEPAKNVPKILNSAMILVITTFILAVTAFYSVLPIEKIQGTDAVATAFGAELFGRAGAIFYTWMICLSCLGSLNSTVFSTGRLTQAAAARHFVPAFLFQTPSLNKTNLATQVDTSITVKKSLRTGRMFGLANDPNLPIKPMLLNGLIAAAFVVVGSFRGLLSFKGMVEYAIYFVTACGLLKIRWYPRSTQLDLSGVSYKTSILNPVIFCSISGFIALQSAVSHWVAALAVCFFLATGTALYKSPWWQRLVAENDADDSS